MARRQKVPTDSPRAQLPGYHSAYNIAPRRWLTIMNGQEARAKGLFPDSTNLWLLVRDPEGDWVEFDRVGAARDVARLVQKGAAFERFLPIQMQCDHQTFVIQDFADWDQRFVARMLSAIQPAAVVQVFDDAMKATKYVRTGKDEYSEVPDHVVRLQGAAYYLAQTRGVPVQRQPLEEKTVVDLSEFQTLLQNPDFRRAMEDAIAAAAPNPEPNRQLPA